MDKKNTTDKNKNKFKNKKYKINFTRLFLIICFLFFLITFIKQQMAINEYNVKIKYVEQKIANHNEETKRLSEQEKLSKDSEYLETLAREKLGLVKPYEKIFIDINK